MTTGFRQVASEMMSTKEVGDILTKEEKVLKFQGSYKVFNIFTMNFETTLHLVSCILHSNLLNPLPNLSSVDSLVLNLSNKLYRISQRISRADCTYTATWVVERLC